MRDHQPGEIVPRQLPEGDVPLVSVEGCAYDCGCEYADIVLSKYPQDCSYLDMAEEWRDLPKHVVRLFERYAPHILDVYRGLLDVRGKRSPVLRNESEEACTSFGVSGLATLDGRPLSGQTKDTRPESAEKYVVLRMRIVDAPTILVLAYPGEVLGYGLWSNGMSIFRNNLHSTAGAETGLTMVQWGLLAMACGSIPQAVEILEEHGLAESGNCLVSDCHGDSVSVEFNVGGVSVVRDENGISTHANHPVGKLTSPFGYYADPEDMDDSRFRMRHLRELLEAEYGRLTVQKATMLLADHAHYPRGICRHLIPDGKERCTTASVVAEPVIGRLSVVRGNPCSNWARTYML